MLVEEQEPGVWPIRTATVIPDNERWLHEPRARADLDAALVWAATHPPDDSSADRILADMNDRD